MSRLLDAMMSESLPKEVLPYEAPPVDKGTRNYEWAAYEEELRKKATLSLRERGFATIESDKTPFGVRAIQTLFPTEKPEEKLSTALGFVPVGKVKAALGLAEAVPLIAGFGSFKELFAEAAKGKGLEKGARKVLEKMFKRPSVQADLERIEKVIPPDVARRIEEFEWADMADKGEWVSAPRKLRLAKHLAGIEASPNVWVPSEAGWYKGSDFYFPFMMAHEPGHAWVDLAADVILGREKTTFTAEQLKQLKALWKKTLPEELWGKAEYEPGYYPTPKKLLAEPSVYHLRPREGHDVFEESFVQAIEGTVFPEAIRGNPRLFWAYKFREPFLKRAEELTKIWKGDKGTGEVWKGPFVEELSARLGVDLRSSSKAKPSSWLDWYEKEKGASLQDWERGWIRTARGLPKELQQFISSGESLDRIINFSDVVGLEPRARKVAPAVTDINLFYRPANMLNDGTVVWSKQRVATHDMSLYENAEKVVGKEVIASGALDPAGNFWAFDRLGDGIPEGIITKADVEKAGKNIPSQYATRKLQGPVFKPGPARFVEKDFQPTPDKLTERMLSKLSGHDDPSLTWLEPSAGEGHILDRMTSVKGMKLAVEAEGGRRQILAKKGYDLAGRNFFDFVQPVDRIAMNPPFSQGQSKFHIQHAWDLLKPGGELVGLVPWYEVKAKNSSKAFKSWLEDIGATLEEARMPVTKDNRMRVFIIHARKPR